jgi:NADH:ubiquinone oxidoreductase subunit F (NADH-binding)
VERDSRSPAGLAGPVAVGDSDRPLPRDPQSAGGRPVAVHLWSDIRAPRLLLDAQHSETLAQYTARTPSPGRYGLDGEQLAAVAEQVDLRGRGGAGFPFATKLRAVAAATAGEAGVAHVVANGEEGEPSSAKDRYLLATRPHLVLDGLLLVATALTAGRAHLYVSDDDLVPLLRAAVRELETPVPIEVFQAPRGYVSGEETAVVRALSGGPAKPTAKPPRPFESGVDGSPTLVSNVETLAHLARAVRFGPAMVACDGPAHAPGTTLLTVVPDIGTPRLVEVPFGVTLRQVLHALGGFTRGAAVPPLLAGGFFGGFLPQEALDLPISHDALRAAGPGLGCGAFLVLLHSCPVSAAADVLAYFDRENAHQCGACFNGTAAMHAALARLADGAALPDDIANLRRWGTTLPGRGACATLDGAARVALSLLEQHQELTESHVGERCVRCHEDAFDRSDTRFRVRWPTRPQEER